jgi:hypothetical protein
MRYSRRKFTDAGDTDAVWYTSGHDDAVRGSGGPDGAVVTTGEMVKYGNIILKKGVAPWKINNGKYPGFRAGLFGPEGSVPRLPRG